MRWNQLPPIHPSIYICLGVMAVKCQASSLLGRLDLVALQLLPGDSRQKRAQAQATREGWQDGQCMSAQVILQHIQTDWSENQIFEGSNMLKYYGCSASHLLSPSFPQRSFPQPVLPPPCSTQEFGNTSQAGLGQTSGGTMWPVQQCEVTAGGPATMGWSTPSRTCIASPRCRGATESLFL